MTDPWLLLILTAAGGYVARLWWADLRAAERGAPAKGALPGATRASGRTLAIAAAGGILIVALETAGERALGIDGEQSKMTWLFAAYAILAAPVVEELIFRGWLVAESRGRTTQWAAAAGASALFAALHPFLWRWGDAGLEFTPTHKGWFSTAAVLGASLWFYALRLGAWNPTRSLLPCFVAHAAKNAGVVAAKAATGFMGGLY